MKKTILITAVLMITAITGVFAQKNSLKSAPLDLIGGRFGLTYERSTKKNLSVLFTYKTINSRDNGLRPADVVFPLLSSLGGRTTSRTTGYIAEFAVRKYAPGKNNMAGLYLQPSLIFGEKIRVSQFNSGILGVFSEKEPPTTVKKDLNSLGFRMGYQWVTSGGFTLDLGLGGNRYFNPLNKNKGSVLFNCKLGYAF